MRYDKYVRKVHLTCFKLCYAWFIIFSIYLFLHTNLVYAAKAEIFYVPNPIPPSSSAFNISIGSFGKPAEGFGDYILSIGIISNDGVFQSDPSDARTYKFVVDENFYSDPTTGKQCPQPFKKKQFDIVSCSVVEKTKQEWNAVIKHTIIGVPNVYYALLTTNGQLLQQTCFTVGDKDLCGDGGLLGVKIKPNDPNETIENLQNSKEHKLILTWIGRGKGIENITYNITNTALGITKNVECKTPSFCLEEITIPAAAPDGTHRIEVSQSNSPTTIKGSAAIKITAIVAPSNVPFVWPTTTTAPSPGVPPCKAWTDLANNPILTSVTPNPSIKCAKINTAVGDISTDPTEFVKRLFGIILSLSGGIALLLIIFAGYQLMTSRGNAEKVQGAKETLASAIIGLFFIIFSLVILQIIGVDILRIPGFNP